MKKHLIIITIILSVFIVTTVAVSFMLVKSNKLLKSFNIISVTNVNTKFNIRFEKVNAATKYKLIIYNSDNTVFYSEDTNKNNISLDLNNIVNENKYLVVVYAFDKYNDSIVVNNPFEFIYNEPTFNKDNSIVLINDEDYLLKIDGDLKRKEYYITINDSDYVIKKEKLTSNEYIIPKSLFTGIKQVFTINLLDNNNIINSIDLYSNINPIEDIKITNPTNLDTLDYKDINLTYTGGDNASEYILQIYNDTNLIKEIPLKGNNVVISKDFFKKGNNYSITLKAKLMGYLKSDTISFTINEKDTLLPVYLSNNEKYMNKGSYLMLNNPNGVGTIYYTLDGSDPLESGIEYKDKILVDANMTLKTVIKDKKYLNSSVSTYNITINKKDNYIVCLNELNNEELININNTIKNKLSIYNITTYHSDYKDIILNNIKCDMYLELRNKESANHDIYGIESLINNEDSSSYNIANIIHNDLISIYPKKDGNRHIKYAYDSINELLLNNSVIIYLGYSDNDDDILWLNDKELIGTTISNSIIKYFGLI